MRQRHTRTNQRDYVILEHSVDSVAINSHNLDFVSCYYLFSLNQLNLQLTSFKINPEFSSKVHTTSEENRTLTRQFVENGDLHASGESGSEAEDQVQSQLLDRKILSSEVDRKINAIVAQLATQLETLIQSVTELSERSSNRSTEGSERLRSLGQRSDRGNLRLDEAYLQSVVTTPAHHR